MFGETTMGLPGTIALTFDRSKVISKNTKIVKE